MNNKNNIRVLGEGLSVEIDPKSTPSNNFLVCGETGAGKTTFVINNLLASQNESLIIVDAKSNLYNRFSKVLSKKGFRTERIDFIGNSSTIGYNPLDHVRFDKNGRALIDDIKELAGYIVGDEYDSEKDPFWRHGAQQYVACALALCLRLTPESEHTLPIVSSIMELMTQNEWNILINEARIDDPDGYIMRLNNQIDTTRTAERMSASIMSIAQSAMNQFLWSGAESLYSNPRRINFSELFNNNKRVALFLEISDHEEGKNAVIKLFLSQLLKSVLDCADNEQNSRLKHNLHLYLDDVANYAFPGLNSILSIARSRGLNFTLLMQSINQLYSKYGLYEGNSIISNCHGLIYLGGSDITTAQYFSTKSNTPLERTTLIPNDTELVCLGNKTFFAKKNNYKQIEDLIKPEADLEKCVERGDDYGTEAS